MKKRAGSTQGYTLVEVMVASTIAVIIVGGATAMLVNALRALRSESVRTELHIDLETAMERIRNDLRLSSVGIGLMAFHPHDATEYKAISFPLATPGADGMLTRDSDGRLIWDTTVIYHVRPGTPDELIRTTFRPRNSDASPEQLYDQLEAVVASSDISEIISAALVGETASSRIIFRNLVNMFFRPPWMEFDGYAPQYERARTINWGSVVLSNGVNELNFSVIGKNPLSTGHNVGIDRFALSYSASPREGEIVLPRNTHPVAPFYDYSINRGTVAAEDMSAHGASWSGNCQLTFRPPTGNAPGSRITFYVDNDLWCDTNFDNPTGVISSNCSRKVDNTFTNQEPYIPDIVVSMDAGISWDVGNVTDGTSHSVLVTNLTMVNVIHGGTNTPAAIMLNGAWARLQFSAGPGTSTWLYVRNAGLARQSSGLDPVPGTYQSLSFSGSSAALIAPGHSRWTDWVRYEIDRDASYLVSWQRYNGDDWLEALVNNARTWNNNEGHTMMYRDGIPDNRVFAVAAMEVRVPSNAVYRSGVFDTRVQSPAYRRLSWTQVEPWPEGDIDIRVRSANSPDMSDACPWFPPGYFQNNVNNDIGAISGGRYVQYEALFTASGNHVNQAILRDVTIAWDAPTGIVDLMVDLARGPNYGIFAIDVNGQPFVKGIELEMEIFRQGPQGMVSVSGITEVRPMNTRR